MEEFSYSNSDLMFCIKFQLFTIRTISTCTPSSPCMHSCFNSLRLKCCRLCMLKKQQVEKTLSSECHSFERARNFTIKPLDDKILETSHYFSITALISGVRVTCKSAWIWKDAWMCVAVVWIKVRSPLSKKNEEKSKLERQEERKPLTEKREKCKDVARRAEHR